MRGMQRLADSRRRRSGRQDHAKKNSSSVIRQLITDEFIGNSLKYPLTVIHHISSLDHVSRCEFPCIDLFSQPV